MLAVVSAVFSVSAAVVVPLPPSGALQRAAVRSHTLRQHSPRLCDDAPSDSGDDDIFDAPAAEDPAAARTRLKAELLGLGAACNRGEAATLADKEAARRLASSLESYNPTADPTLSATCRLRSHVVCSSHSVPGSTRAPHVHITLPVPASVPRFEHLPSALTLRCAAMPSFAYISRSRANVCGRSADRA